jgi:hypothetical protein
LGGTTDVVTGLTVDDRVGVVSELQCGYSTWKNRRPVSTRIGKRRLSADGHAGRDQIFVEMTWHDYENPIRGLTNNGLAKIT